MLMVGIFYNLVKGRGKIIVNKVASILILILSLVMLNRALLAFEIDFIKKDNDYNNYTSSYIDGKYQIVDFNLEYTKYEDIIVQKDIPVKMIIHVDKKYLTSCNSQLELKDYNKKVKLEVGDNIIEFTPTKEGIYTYTCSMNMIKNNIKVVDDIKYFKGNKNEKGNIKN